MGMSKKHKRVFSKINETAKPGDILFMHSEMSPEELSLKRQVKRRIGGYHPSDLTNWHTALYSGSTNSGDVKLIEAVVQGVRSGHLPSNYYTKSRVLQIGRIKHQNLSDDKREEIVDAANSYVGKKFNKKHVLGIPITKALGIANPFAKSDEYVCQSMVARAYQQAEVDLKVHPDGIMDHDLYQLPSLEIIMSVHEDDEKKLVVNDNPVKYSWNTDLRKIYGMEQASDQQQERIIAPVRYDMPLSPMYR